MIFSPISNRPLPNCNAVMTKTVHMKESREKSFIRTFPLLFCGAVLAILFVCGCASSPSLRALNVAEAKIVVRTDGTVLVLGQPVPIDTLHEVVENSDTEGDELILVKLLGDPDSKEMKSMQRIISREMAFAKHYKFTFISVPQATVQTTDPLTGKVSVQVSDQDVNVLSGSEIHAEADRIAAEQRAYADGSYVSPAVTTAEKARVERRPEEVSPEVREQKLRRTYERQRKSRASRR